MFLFDTNVISELRRPRPHGAVLQWVESIDPEMWNLSAATVGEIQAGIERARVHDAVKAVEIEGWLEDLLHRITVLPMDTETFRIWARIMHGKPRDILEDAMIAATALRHRLTVATRNVRDFELFSVPLINPFVTT